MYDTSKKKQRRPLSESNHIRCEEKSKKVQKKIEKKELNNTYPSKPRINLII